MPGSARSTTAKTLRFNLARYASFVNGEASLPQQEYVDKGISGSRERRPALDRLLADCRRRSIDAVVVYRYDRFARSLRQLVNALEEFRSLGIDFISIHEGVDTSTPNGRLSYRCRGSELSEGPAPHPLSVGTSRQGQRLHLVRHATNHMEISHWRSGCYTALASRAHSRGG